MAVFNPGEPAAGQAELWAQSHGADSLPADLWQLLTAAFEAGWAACAAQHTNPAEGETR